MRCSLGASASRSGIRAGCLVASRATPATSSATGAFSYQGKWVGTNQIDRELGGAMCLKEAPNDLATAFHSMPS